MPSPVDRVYQLLKDKYGNHRIPTADEVFAAAYDPETQTLAVTGGGGGQTTYTTVVPDDYATLSEALAEASDGDSILVKAGDYAEAGGTFSVANIRIVGQGQKSSNLTLNANLTLSGEHVSFDSIGVDTNGFKLSFTGEYASITNNLIDNGSIVNFLTIGNSSGFHNNDVRASSATGTVIFDSRNRISGNRFVVPHHLNGGVRIDFYNSFTSNFFYRFANNYESDTRPLLRTWGERSTVAGNMFFCGMQTAFRTDFRTTFTGNSVFQSGGTSSGSGVYISKGCTATGNTIGHSSAGNCPAITLDGTTPQNGSYTTLISSNNISLSGVPGGTNAGEATANALGIKVLSTNVNAIITGNSVAGGQYGIIVDSGATGTMISNNAFTWVTMPVTDNGTGTIVRNNLGAEDSGGDLPFDQNGYREEAYIGNLSSDQIIGGQAYLGSIYGFDGSTTMYVDPTLEMGGQIFMYNPTPSEPEHLASKQYVDSVAPPTPPTTGTYQLQSVDGVMSWVSV